MGAIRGLCRIGKIYELGRFAPNLYLTFGRRLLGTFPCGAYSLFWFFVLGGREASRRRVRDVTARRYCGESGCVCIPLCLFVCVFFSVSTFRSQADTTATTTPKAETTKTTTPKAVRCSMHGDAEVYGRGISV